MEIGVSTASLFLRAYNEEALTLLNGIDARVAEVFLQTFSEYSATFGERLKGYLNNVKAHSVHVVTTQYEPQLFAENEKAFYDALDMFEGVLACAKTIGATNYTMHGRAYFKKNYSTPDDIERYVKRFNIICDLAERYGVNVCLENVYWCMYSYVGFFKKLKDKVPKLCACLDLKQARQSGYSEYDYLAEMGSSLKTVHLSDIDENGKMCLPGRGVYDFERLFTALKDANFNGNMLVEVYKDDYVEIDEIADSLHYLREIKNKIFEV